MLLYLNGYFDQQIIPQFEINSEKILPTLSDNQKNQITNLHSSSNLSNNSTRNLLISSCLQERSSLITIDSKAESISKIIDSKYRVTKISKLQVQKETNSETNRIR